MMKKLISLSAVAVAAALAAPAMAQEEGAAFSGPYVAGIVGYDKVRIDTPVGAGSDDGILYGAAVGYDLNVRGVVLGVEGEFSDSNVKETAEDVFVLGDSASVKTGRDLYAGIRLGGEVVPGVLLYAKGGYTNAKAKLAYDDGVDVTRGSTDLEGYRLGAGVETTVAGFLGRVEYRYSSYGDHQGTGLQPERHQVALLLGRRF